MNSSRQWISPFLKQCFVTAGVSLNMASTALVMGFAAGLLEQLRMPGSSIPIDDSSGSWIAALPAFSLFFGNFFVIPIMDKYGRRTANLISIVPLIVGWVIIIFTTSIPTLLLARFLHGIFMGMSLTLGSLLIGEYTSPKNRGAFLMTISVSMSVAVFSVHVLGSYLIWQTAAMVCAGVALVDLLIVLCSPESPNWLAVQGRYEDSKRVFRWLRGNNEESELQKMIEASMIIRESHATANISEISAKKLRQKFIYFNSTIRKSAFYKPVIIMIHIYVLSQWSGVNVVVAYTTDLFDSIVGKDADVPVLIMTLDTQRIISNIVAVYIIKKIKRRTMLFVTVGINIAALVAIAVYSYAKENYTLSFDHPLIGIILAHCMIFSIGVGTLPLSFIIAGEIFPLEFKNLASGVSVLVHSLNMFISFKTVPFLLNNLGLYGTFGSYAAILIYCVLVSYIMLPETKDRTLQDIEDEFRGKQLSIENLKSMQSLTSWRVPDSDHRCSQKDSKEDTEP